MHIVRTTGTRISRTLVGLTALALVTACGSAPESATPDDTADEATASTGAGQPDGFSFTDDRGVTIELDEVPDVVVAHSAAAGGLWEYGVTAAGVFGPLRRTDGTTDPSLGRADPDDFTSLGEVDTQINLEALAELQPDLIVTQLWSEDTWHGVDTAQVDELEQIAPLVGIRVDNRSAEEPLARYAELAEALGGDPEAIEEARAEFDDATGALEEAAAAQPDLDVVAASGSPSEMYIAWPPGFPDLSLFTEYGLDIYEPEEHPTAGGFWQTLSWEDATRYPADLILADARAGGVETMLEQVPEVVRGLPAVQADQMIEWETSHAYGYGNFADMLNDLATAVAEADPTVADAS